MSEGGFLGRWSRRKLEVKEQREKAPLPTPEATASPLETPRPDRPPEGEGEQSPLTLADTETLTIDSDFKPFLARAVAPEVKNAAFRKLFADPHFNVMDRLDIYIDDYSIPSPLPESVLRQMASAKFLNLFEEEDDPEPAAGAEAAAARETPRDEVPEPDVAQSEPSGDPPSPLVADAQPASQKTDDPNADLRLQPDDAARAEYARHRTG